MPARTGQEFLAGLRTPRNIWVGDGKVTDVVDHPAFTGAAHALAEVFDLQHKHPKDCLAQDPETGEAINVSHILPRSREDLLRRHVGLERTAELTVGLMGRTPDYMNVTFGGFAATPSIWSAHGNEKGGANLIAFQKEMRRRDLSLTHTIINTTTDRTLGDVPKAGNDLALRKVGETEHGIIVRGARVLATLAPFSDELACYAAYPLPEDASDYALVFSIPTTAPGLKFICRDSCAAERNLFDHPLSARFDEQDAFVIFDDVEVPHNRVFVDGNVTAYNHAWKMQYGPNFMQQTMIRAQTKLEFAWGLATRLAKITNAFSPPVDELLGELWCYAEFARSAINAAEMQAEEVVDGAWFPKLEPLHALRCFMPTWAPRVNEIIRLIGSHNLLATPSAAQMEDPELAPFIKHYLRGAKEISAEERVRVFRLAWDFVGSALASRNEQYERFYLASGARNRQLTGKMITARDRATRLVDRFVKEDVGVPAKRPCAVA